MLTEPQQTALTVEQWLLINSNYLSEVIRPFGEAKMEKLNQAKQELQNEK